MPSDNTYNNATAIAASLEQSRDTRTYQHAVTDASFHHHRQPPQAAADFQAESLPCPRCDSKNTKFCYYNNYNLSQPRHFCKACRRYWTHGGTIRNIPVGGGTRKSSSISYHASNKRPRSSTATASNCSFSSTVLENDGAPITKPSAAGFVMATGVIAPADGVSAVADGSSRSGFPSHLSTPSNNTFFALGEYGPGSMSALDWFRFGFGQGVFPFAEAGFIEGGGYGGFHGPMVCPAGIEAWHVGPGGDGGSSGDSKGGSEGCLTEREGFAWPELAISMPGQGLK